MYGLENSDSCAFPDYSEDSTCYVTMWKRQLFADDTNITHCVKSERAAVDFPSGSCHILYTVCRPAVFDKKRLLLIRGEHLSQKMSMCLIDIHMCRSRNNVYPTRALRALGLLLADGAPTVGGGKTF